MAISVIKDTIEQIAFQTDSDGQAIIVRRVNLQNGFRRQLVQVDVFEDAIPFESSGSEKYEVVISAYPAIPTGMRFSSSPNVRTNRLPAAGDDSVLFKLNGNLNSDDFSAQRQFPSEQISARNTGEFYSDHVYITYKFWGNASTSYGNLALSFLMVFNEVKVNALTGGIGKMAENHNAMCAEVMSTGSLTNDATLQGNTFPMWRYGGIVGEHMVDPTASGSFFLEINTLDNELMQTSATIRANIRDARTMSAFDEPQGLRFPEWILMGLNQGLVSGQVRDQWPPIKHADNGNVRML